MVFFKWIFWTLFFACLLGGKPWLFPENGKYLFQGETPQKFRAQFYD